MPGPYTATRKNENMNIIEITDLSAPELAPYTKLTEAQLRNKLEPEKGIFIAESPKVIGTALDAGCEPLSFLMERRQIDGPAAGVLARCPDAAVYTADRSVLQALTERAQAGVQVRLLVDALGSKRLGRRHYQALLDAGAEVALFHPPKLGRRLRPVINFRTHRKIVVIDGTLGFTGGVNITDTEDKRLQADPCHAYHDIHLRLQGPVVSWLQHVFLEDWAYALDYRHPAMPQDFAALLPPQDDGPALAQIMASGPDSPLEAIHRVFVDACYAAHQRLWLATPYFVPTEAALLALTSAALRGVDVRVLVPERSDSLLVTCAARSYFDELLECGVKVYLYQKRMLHAKTMVVDDMLGMVGTANFDTRSFRLNYEVCALVYTPVFAQQLADQFSRDLAQAERIFEHRPQPLPQRLSDAVARLFSPLL